MINARTLGAVHTHTHTSNSIREIEGTKAFSYSTKNKWAINNNCSFNVQKNEKKSHLSQLITHNSGVTLVALVVTIIVLLILAGVSITALLGDDGIIKKAQDAADLMNNAVQSEQNEINALMNELDEIIIGNGGSGTTPGGDTEVVATGISVSPTSVTLKEGETSQLTATVTPNNATNKGVTWSSDNAGIATVSNGLVRGVTEGTTIIRVKTTDGSNKEATCSVTVESAGLSASEIAQEIASNPDKYYGKTVTGYTAANSSVVGWKIFYAGNEFSSDGSYHVYLIADNYIPRENIPQSSGGHSLNAGFYPRAAYFTNILNDYSGSSSVTNAQIKKLNNDYFTKGYSSTYENMKAVAYMLDTAVWSVYAGEDANYAVGGPSIEMIMKSYSQKHGVDYRAQASSATGYQISNNGGSSWANAYDGMLSKSDSLYVINSLTNAAGYWVASPSARDYYDVMGVEYRGCVTYGGDDPNSSSVTNGFRFPPRSLSKL